MNELNFDERLFLWLNFDGGAVMDSVMSAVSGAVMWLPLYLFIAWAVLRKYGWKSLIAFLVCLALAMGIADMLCGVCFFKSEEVTYRSVEESVGRFPCSPPPDV